MLSTALPRAGLTLALLFALAAPAAAQAPLYSGLGGDQGYGTECLFRNDDRSSSAIDITPAFPSGLRFFDSTFTTVYVNTNGNITFGGGVSTYTPDAFPLSRTPTRPMIAPFWADVDTREAPGSGTCSTESAGTCSGGDNSIWWHLEPNRMVVTWHEVGYFSCNNDLRMNFQLILTGVPSCGGGATDFDVEFRFNRCEWETGDASGGSGGFGGTPAQSGFDAGNGRDYVAIAGSRTEGIASRLCTMSNVDDTGVWRFQIRSGTVVCPEAGEFCDTGMMGVCAEGVTQCVGEGTACQPVVPSSDESCDALDNDCDGAVDEGDGLCTSATAVCDRGVCVDVCFEGGCPPGQMCSEAGRCVEEGCEDVECPAGQRCVAGECQDACEGVVCPAGLSCRAGRCLDLCEDVECDPECTACFEGECIARCDLEGSAGCEAGETCTADGLCEPTACIGVSCAEGEVCRDGAGCVDACEGAICPNGEVCELGRCVSAMSVEPEMDAGMMSAEDAGMEMEEPDAGAEADAGRMVPRRDDGCGCVTPGAPREAPAGLLALVGLAWLARRRRR